MADPFDRDMRLIVEMMNSDSIGGFLDPPADPSRVQNSGCVKVDVGALGDTSDHMALAARFVELVGGVDRALDLVGKVDEVAQVLDDDVVDAAVIDRIGSNISEY